MIVNQGENFHLVMRRMYESQLQRHFVGVVDATDGAIVRAAGYSFLYDPNKAQYIKEKSIKTTVFDVTESGYIINFIPSTVEIADLRYVTIDRAYLVLPMAKTSSSTSTNSARDGSGLVILANVIKPLEC